MSKKKTFDLYTFVAGAALERGKPFPLKCNCGGIVTIMPPFQEESVICPECESSIGILTIDGDPGYIIGRDSAGNPTLLTVQGSSAKPPDSLSPQEYSEILEKIERELKKKQVRHGDSQ